MKKFIWVFFVTHLYASSCEFIVDDISYFKQQLGNIIIDKATSDTIWISTKSPVSVKNINPDYMYVLINDKNVNYLRFSALNEALYEGDSIKIKHVSWAFPENNMQGKYRIESYKNNRKSQFTQTLNTIGDSITWACFGRYFRCLLRDDGLEYDFVGSHTDTFGFGHDGEGGNTSTKVLQRIDKIKAADYYFLLIGTNDWMEKLTPEKTVDNINKISSLLNKKNNGRVYISTILPTLSNENARINKINNLLLQYNFCKDCIVIDVAREFLNLPEYKSYLKDGVHPNLDGYKKLSEIIIQLINSYHPTLIA